MNSSTDMTRSGEKCVIIAAGRGSRLAGRAVSKPLMEVRGQPLIEWVIKSARQADFHEFVVVTGYMENRLKSFLSRLEERHGLSIETVFNKDWPRGNGISVLKVRNFVNGRFLLLMSDHIIEPLILSRLRAMRIDQGVALAVDYRVGSNSYVDESDATKVLAEKNKLIDIGKSISCFNAYDTGAFLCTPDIFESIERSLAAGDSSLSGGIKNLAGLGKVSVIDIGESFWIDVDDETAWRKAEEATKNGACRSLR